MQLHYRQLGTSGDPLVILHGLYGASDNWMGIGRHLAQKFVVYLVDVRNHGHSPHNAEHSYEAMVSDLALFLQQEEIGKAVVMGHSMGGKIAMKYAAGYPNSISKLVVVDIAPKNYIDVAEQSGQYGFHRHLIRTMLNAGIDNCRSLTEIDELLEPQIPDRRLRKFLMKNITRDATKRYHWRLNLHALDQWLDEIVGGVGYEMFAKHKSILDYPVLFIKGDNSPYIGADDIDQIKLIYPDAQIAVIPKAGHWLHAENPDAFIDALNTFL